MNWTNPMRQGHRWLSIVFTATVVLNFAVRAIAPGEPSPWITYAPLPPAVPAAIVGPLPVRAALPGETARPVSRLRLPKRRIHHDVP